MFNTVRAPFSGTVDDILIQGGDGTIVQKGQPLFRITPDERLVDVDPEEAERERRTRTSRLVAAVLASRRERPHGRRLPERDGPRARAYGSA